MFQIYWLDFWQVWFPLHGQVHQNCSDSIWMRSVNVVFFFCKCVHVRPSSWFHDGQRWCDKRLLLFCVPFMEFLNISSVIGRKCVNVDMQATDGLNFLFGQIHICSSSHLFGWSKIRDRNSSCMFAQTNFAHNKCHKIAVLWWDGIYKVFERVETNERTNEETWIWVHHSFKSTWQWIKSQWHHRTE